tara:strand:+ start:2574 stop:3683 length:1110 start_codon:yes stop_codon:yes gene_type:complete
MKQNISVIGIGKLGLCFSLTLEKAGYCVRGVDINTAYVEAINSKSFSSDEPGVNKYLKESNNFIATTNLEEAVSFSRFLYVVIDTPSLPNGEYDHSRIDNLITELISLGKQDSSRNLIICSTTFPGYCDKIQSLLSAYNYNVFYNPEFIAQGTILRDQLSPDMVLIGESTVEGGDEIEAHYKKMTNNTPTFCRVSCLEAEICKLSLNCFLTTKISYANMIGDICVASGASPDKVLGAIGKDSRISSKYLGFGYGYGGPCFPRDNKALRRYALSRGREAPLCKAADEMNDLHLTYQFDDYIKKFPDKTKPIELGPITYKPESTILTESQQLKFAEALALAGYIVHINERAPVLKVLKAQFGDLFIYKQTD